MLPEEELLAAFWRCILTDLVGKGTTPGSRRNRHRGLPYPERVIIEREQLQTDAKQFVDSPAFQVWADRSGLDSIPLRTKLYATNHI